MKKHYRHIIFWFLMGISCQVSSQYQYFSQYHYTPIHVNPALAGAGDEAMAIVNHRQQQYNSNLQVNSTLLSLIRPLYVRSSGRRWGGVGISALHRKFDDEQSLTEQGIDVSIAYHFSTGENHHLTWGLSGGFFRRELSMEGFTTGSQWITNFGFDPDAAIGESFAGDQSNFISVNTGLLWQYIPDNGRVKGYFGVSGYNLNQPDVGFLASEDQQPVRLLVHGGYAVYDNSRISIMPELLFARTAEVNDPVAGVSLKYSFESLNPYTPLKSGSLDFSTRYGVESESVILGLQVIQPDFVIGFSYDLYLRDDDGVQPFNNSPEFVIALKKNIAPSKRKKQVVSDYTLGDIKEFYRKTDETVEAKEPCAPCADTVVVKNDVEDLPDVEDFHFELRKDFKFEFNSYELNDEARAYLDDLYNLLVLNPHLRLEVIGHTDNIGTKAANRKISGLRAKAVTDYLEEKGISKKRLKSTGRSDETPLVDNNTEENRSLNRRVEFVIYKD